MYLLSIIKILMSKATRIIQNERRWHY